MGKVNRKVPMVSASINNSVSRLWVVVLQIPLDFPLTQTLLRKEQPANASGNFIVRRPKRYPSRACRKKEHLKGITPDEVFCPAFGYQPAQA